ncbi:hypothetical protein SAY86_025278 [Trapa natans]|uniref:Fanconi-associated nuclease n=1 Tax=Trapa natans TaxID=22666 RepID=A0AAN7MWP2_TRANT|nr:hypothetical protein SAY86_025278 [Trapa natans]
MLTGRESLIRLVGRRRRFLINHNLLSSTVIPPCLRATYSYKNCADSVNRGKYSDDGVNGVTVSDESKIDQVTCPVCGNQVSGGDSMINSHLDTCLSRGTKRKLTQRTLLQLNFIPVPKVEVCSDELESPIPSTHSSFSSGVCIIQNSVSEVNHHDKAENCKLELVISNGSSEILSGDYKPDTPSLSSENSKLELEISNGSSEILSGDYKRDTPSLSFEDVHVEALPRKAIDTFIVGRKFSDQRELLAGTIVTLFREPDNAKDPNAVKVLSVNPRCSKALGYLPRQLAQHVSPLLEKFRCNLEGYVVSVPEHYLDAVPIQITCPEIVTYDVTKDNYLEEMIHIWGKAVQEAEASKKNPPNSTKYQQNFHVLVNEVLTSFPHLFSDIEKLFIESFKSLSDDSQRLFIRLYTRKGPWFRFSSISYPEISNVQQAVNDLSATGYVIALESSGVSNDEMMGVLKTLTVSELQEIPCLLKKPFTSKFGFRESRSLCQNIHKS